MRWPLMRDTITEQDRYAMIKFIMTADRFTNGPEVKKFEHQWSQWLSPQNQIYSLFVSSGSTANFLLTASVMELYNINPGDKILLPACTWMTNVAPPIQLGLEPIFCDINLQNFSFDLDHAAKIAQDHPDVKLIFISHLLGFPAPKQTLVDLFPNAKLIDDVCESHGCLDSDGSKVGSNSLGATFSFYYGHHMTSIEGGVVSTTSYDLYDLMRMKRSHGLARESMKFNEYTSQYPNIQPSFMFITDGYNFRNHEISAVLAQSQLSRLDEYVDIRRANYSFYSQLMNKYSSYFYPHQFEYGNSSFCFPFIGRTHSIYQTLVKTFADNGIEYRPIVAGNLLQQPFLKKYQTQVYKNADVAHDNGVYIGNNHFVTLNDMSFLDSILEKSFDV